MSEEREKARQAVLTVSKDNDQMRRELERLKGSKTKEAEAKTQAMNKAYEKTAKQLQATLSAKITDMDRDPGTTCGRDDLPPAAIRSLQTSLLASDADIG